MSSGLPGRPSRPSHSESNSLTGVPRTARGGQPPRPVADNGANRLGIRPGIEQLATAFPGPSEADRHSPPVEQVTGLCDLIAAVMVPPGMVSL
jgi:hypothetical protein